MTIRELISVFSKWERFAVANPLNVVFSGGVENVPEDMYDIEVKWVHVEDERIMIEI